MSERKISQRYVVPIAQTLDATGTFSKTIMIPFIPNEVHIKQVFFYLNGTTPGIFQLRCDSLVEQSNSNLTFFYDPVAIFTGIKYNLSRSPNGSHTFQVIDTSTGNPTTALDTGKIAFHLEFRRWA